LGLEKVVPRGLGRSLFILFVSTVLWTTAPAASGASAAELDSPAVTVYAAGDIADCNLSILKRVLSWWRGADQFIGGYQTANLLSHNAGPVLVLGDLAYPFARQADVSNCIERTWGRFRNRIARVPGNHDAGVFDGARIGWSRHPEGEANRATHARTSYSFAAGAWHIVALDSTLAPLGLRAQEAWLRADLASADEGCILAYWHHPVFSSGRHGDSKSMARAYRLLYEAGASILLAAHDHDYERFAPLAPDGSVDRARGIRNFIVGTGGHKLDKVGSEGRTGSEVFSNTSWGVLKLTLSDGRYEWEFIPVPGHSLRDSGTGRCVDRKRRTGAQRN